MIARPSWLLAFPAAVLLLATPPDAARSVRAAEPAPAAERDGSRDFDFCIGTWRTDVRVLSNRLSESAEWLEFAGTSVVRPIWGGRANLVELDVEGPGGRIVGLNLRLYDPRSGEWSLHYANARNGALTPPVTGRFVDGRGEFFGTETVDGREVLVRFVISPVSSTEWRYEQAFSADGGATWETNWIAIDTLVSRDPG
ncbi:MAG TPA: hypothetical protein VKZ85_09400 [Woeseiaceae bacterium]|nr:hypothetical protein [Woeseiaceae bacterium]